MIGIVVGLFSGAGGSGIILAIISWIRNHKKDKLDLTSANMAVALAVQNQSAEFVEHMMGPLENRLRIADADVDALRRKVRELMIEMNRMAERFGEAEALLRANNLPVPELRAAN